MHDSRTWRQRTGVKTLSHPPTLLVWYKTKFGSQNLATNFGNHL